MPDTAKTLEISLGERAYPIHIGESLAAARGVLEERIRTPRIVVVTDETVAPLYLEAAHAALAQKPVLDVVLPAGEEHKTLETLNLICTRLLEAGLGRDTTLVALGGGVVGDVTGFAAACYQRGVDFVQIPTTLLAQVDSSVGGKTGVNHPLGKNMIGAFYQPRAVVIALETLETLPKRHLSAGLAEIIKYGMILDAEFFARIEESVDALIARDPGALTRAISRSCEIKARIVEEDERESGGRRMLLNLGHTFGHAIEAAAGYGQWLHGEAVGCGLLLAASLSRELGYVANEEVDRVASLLERAGLPREIPPEIDGNHLLELMARDKKNLDGQYRLVLLKRIGEAFVTGEVSRERLSKFLEDFRRS